MTSKRALKREVDALRRDIQVLRVEVEILRGSRSTYTITIPQPPQSDPKQWWQPGGGITCTARRTEGNPVGPGQLED